jgi:hypothetical protein
LKTVVLVNVPTISNKQKNFVKKLFFVGISKATDERDRNRIQIRIRNPKYGSKDPDPDPDQNVTDPEHWVLIKSMRFGNQTL